MLEPIGKQKLLEAEFWNFAIWWEKADVCAIFHKFIQIATPPTVFKPYQQNLAHI